MFDQLRVEKLVHGGQGLATLPDGRKVFIWNALPGELVSGTILKSKRSYAEGVAEIIADQSPARITPRENNYLSTSPWQIMNIDAENIAKKEIVEEIFGQAHVPMPPIVVTAGSDEWLYRNKMEYSFWGDDRGIHLALHQRGSHAKQIVEGSALARSAVDKGAHAVLTELNKNTLRAGDLKTIIVRSNQKNEVVAALFVKLKKFKNLELPDGIKGFRVYYSDPKSPASVATTLIQEYGDVTLSDDLLGQSFTYNVESFFQINLPVYESTLTTIKRFCETDTIIDMYAGVGSIGLSVAKHKVALVELDATTTAMARINAQKSLLDATVTESSTELALEIINSFSDTIFDPPRAGLHIKIINRLLEISPPKIIYLSCNPATQARDIARLQGKYSVVHTELFNFFPRTPHIESLAILERKK
ncbi:MAG: 23S rRNA (uracil(1939)-C(5))-methyltransferase RlmD [Candidatus Saccharimonadales bacterium]